MLLQHTLLIISIDSEPCTIFIQRYPEYDILTYDILIYDILTYDILIYDILINISFKNGSEPTRTCRYYCHSISRCRYQDLH